MTTSDTLPARRRFNIGKAGALAKAVATDGQGCTSTNVVPLTMEVERIAASSVIAGVVWYEESIDRRETMTNENLLTEAVVFAARAHAGQARKGTDVPYIVHPMEAAAVCAGLTDDQEVLAAAVLHDVVEDAGVTVGEIEERFGGRVAAIVAGESEDKRESLPPAQTWKLRKLEDIEHLKRAGDVGVRMVCLGDKLSNIRSIQRDYEVLGDALWQRFNQKDPAEHAWYYSASADVLEGDLGHTEAWREYRERVGKVFGGLDA